MGFWLIAGGLTLAVVALMAAALLRARLDDASGADDLGQDMQVYRDQLAEVERDLERGVLSGEEAGRVRTEVSRRLLEADRAAAAIAAPDRAPRGLTLAFAGLMALIVVGVAGGLYAVLGAPGYPDMPLNQRLAMAAESHAQRASQAEAEAERNVPFTPPEGADASFLELMEKLRAATAKNPGELQGQMLLARNEALLGNFSAAHPAQARVIALKGDAATSDDFATLADLMILAARGYVSPEAEVALTRALQLDPHNGAARYYTGLMQAQAGRPDLAFGIWQPLLAESTPDAPWSPPIMAQIERVAQAAGIRYTLPQRGEILPGPDAGAVAAAGEMSADERQEMIRGMVDGLAERLASEGGTPEEWARLVNALGVLGDTERAQAIWTEAQQVFAESPDALAMIGDAARNAGVAE